MLFNVIGKSFGNWWSKIGYSFLGSLLAAINPFFVLVIMSIFWAFFGNLHIVIASPSMYILPNSILFAIQMAFPTTFIAMVMQKRVIEGEIVYFRDYFSYYLKSYREYIVPSLVLTLAYGIISYFLANSAVVYYHMPISQGMKTAIMSVIVILYIYFMMVQFIFIPILIYRKGINFLKAFQIAMGITVLNFFPILGVIILDGLIYLVFTLLGGTSLLVYFSISLYFRLYLYKQILLKYIPKDAKGTDKEAIENAWAKVMKWKNFTDEELKEKK